MRHRLPAFLALALLLGSLGACSSAAPSQRAQKAPSVNKSAEDAPADSLQSASEEEAPVQEESKDARSQEAAPGDDAARSGALDKAPRREAPAQAKEPAPVSPEPMVAPSAIDVEAAGGSGEVFEGDTFEDSPREQVEELSDEINERMEGYLEEFGVESLQQQPARPTCSQVCDLQEAICGSSRKICDISASRPDEPWFLDRCDWASKHCRDATRSCDGCSG